IHNIFFKFSLASLICIYISLCKADNRQIPAGRELAKRDYQFSKALLINENWTTYGKLFSYGHGIEFDKEGKFKYEFHGEGGCESNFNGLYTIEFQKLLLH